MKKIDTLSPTLFQYCAAGRLFAKLDLLLNRSTGSTGDSFLYLQYTFKHAAIRTISTAHDSESPSEAVVFDYGDFQIRYVKQNPDGTPVKQAQVAGWNRLTNTADLGTKPM